MTDHKYPNIGISGPFCKGFYLYCNFGLTHLVCRPHHLPDDPLVPSPMMQMWASDVYGLQFLSQLHQWKNDHDILEQVFCYTCEDEYTLARYNKQQIIEQLALQLQQRQLVIIPLDSQLRLPEVGGSSPTVSLIKSLVLESGTLINRPDSLSSKLHNNKADNSSVDIVSEKETVVKETKIPGVESELAEKEILKAQSNLIAMLEQKKLDIVAWDKKTQRSFEQWFGTTDKESVKLISDRIDKVLEFTKNLTLENFVAVEEQYNEPGLYAYVYPTDETKIYLGQEFGYASHEGYDSKSGTIAHEISHFNSISGTDDHAYGQVDCINLSKKNTANALNNADSFMYFIEGK